MADYPTGIAIHQWPRDPEIRKMIIPPEGYVLCEHDFSGQELRWMAEYSKDPVMLDIFRNNLDGHAYMGCRIENFDYETLLYHLAKGEEDLDYQKTDDYKWCKKTRYLGKFANLSLQYRTFPKTLRRKAWTDYGLIMGLAQATSIHRTYQQTYVMVPEYWKAQIEFAKIHGYVETFAGKRYRFAEGAWNTSKTWSLESTAINFPIQGVGANEKALAMKKLSPYLLDNGGIFGYDLHDGLFTYLPKGKELEMALEIKDMLSNLPYEEEWGFTPMIPHPVDAKIGPNWGELREVA